MTVTTTATQTSQLATNGVVDEFVFSFPITDTSHLLVELIDLADDSRVELVEGDDYTVAYTAGDQSGTITTEEVYDTGYAIQATRQTPATQPAVLSSSGGWFPKVHEYLYDRVVMVLQELLNGLGLAVSFPSYSAGGIVGWDAEEERLVNYDPEEIGAVGPQGEPGVVPTSFTIVTVSAATLDISAANEATYEGKVVRFTNSGGCVVTFEDDISVGWNMLAEQVDDDAVQFVAGSGATLIQRQSHDRTAGAGAVATVYCAANAGDAAVLVLGGDTAAAP